MKEQILILLNQLQQEAVTPPLFDIYTYCKKAKIELDRPMRIAITGVIKTGKSTLLNGFMGKHIVPTAVEVLTYNVNWFHHVDSSDDGKEKLLVHFHDGNSETFPLSKLDDLVAHKSENKDLLDKIHWVDVYINHPILKVFDLIDTPGLDSPLKIDSEKTLELLTKEKNRPDAIIHLIKKGFQRKDMKAVQEFHQSIGLMVSGINAVAALTRVDEMQNEYTEAQEIIQRNKNEHAEIRYYFSEIFPIAALPAQASKTLSDNDIELLKSLADYEKIDNFMGDKNNFENDLNFISLKERQSLCTQLSIAGIRFSVKYFQHNPKATFEDFRKHLYEFSNVGNLQKYIDSQFGKRADFYKSTRIMAGLKKVCEETSRKCRGQEKEIISSFLRKINLLDYDIHNHYASYYILRDYYNQSDYFNEDDWDKAKRILGEYGQTDVERLGLPEGASENEIQQAYRKSYSYWNNTSLQKHLIGKTIGGDVAKQIAEIVQIFIK